MSTIHTLTLNPVIDLIYQLPVFDKGSTLRCDKFLKIPAGKGFSVSYALSCLDVPSEAYAPLGKNDLTLYEQFCQQRSINLHTATADFGVRQHCTILETNTQAVTHIQSENNQIPPKCVNDLLNQLYRNIILDDYVCISGSMPSSIEPTILPKIISECKKSGATVIVDTSGESLKEAIMAHPFGIKLNQQEAEELTNKTINSYQTAYSVLQSIYQQSKIPLIVVSMGKEGLIGGTESGVWKMRLPVEAERVVDTVGCGDTMVAGIIYGLMQGWQVSEILQQAIAMASAAVLHMGPGILDPKDVAQLIHRIEMEQIGEL